MFNLLYILPIILSAFSYCASTAEAASPEEIEARIAKLEKYYEEADQKSQQYTSDILKFESELTKEYEESMKSEYEKHKDLKIAEALEQKRAMDEAEEKQSLEDEQKQNENIPDFSNDVDLFATNNDKKADEEELKIDNPIFRSNRKPSYVVPEGTKTPVSRKPFTQGYNLYEDDSLVYAKVNSINELAFAKEEATAPATQTGSAATDPQGSSAEAAPQEESALDDVGGVYSGTTSDGTYLFSDELAGFCQLNGDEAVKGNNMTKCINKVLRQLANPKQSQKQIGKDLVEEAISKDAQHGYLAALKYKQRSGSYDETFANMEVEAGNGSDQRDDYEAIATSLREQIKVLYDIIGSITEANKQNAFKALMGTNADIEDEDLNAEYAKTPTGKL